MNMHYNTVVRCNSIQPGVTVSGQSVLVLCESISIIRCKISGVKYQCQISSVR